MEREERTNRLHLARPARHNPPLGVSADVERGSHGTSICCNNVWRTSAPWRVFMTSVRSWAALASVGLAVSAAAVTTGSPASAAPSSGRAALAGSLTAGAERSKPEGRVAAGASVSFDLNLSLRNAAGAQALLKAISTPGSAQYRHYLTQAQWIARFAPTAAAVSSAKTWLRQQGFSVGVVPADRLFIPATGSAAQVERAFNTTL